MADETTTDATEEPGGQSIQGVPIDDQGMAVPQPDESDPALAEPEPTEQPAEGEEEATPEPSEDDNSAWLKKKGIDPTDPEAINKLAKSAREAEKAMHRNAQQRSELEKAAKITDEQVPIDATPEVRDNIRVRNLELRSDIREWKYQNQDKLTLEPEMIKILADPVKKAMVQEGYLTLDDVYSIAKGSTSDEASLKSQGGRAALENLAQKQQAATPRGNAVNTAQMSGNKLTSDNVDSMVARMSPEEYKRRLPEINRAMAS